MSKYAIFYQFYRSDLIVVYGYPRADRPFYTMTDPSDPLYTNSYDFILKGEEILSGAQRVHKHDILLQNYIEMAEKYSTSGLDKPSSDKTVLDESLQAYLNSFKYGAPIHGGAGLGLERIVKRYLSLDNIRSTSLFPRDPKRLFP